MRVCNGRARAIPLTSTVFLLIAAPEVTTA
jgi:hypothetical protein